MQLLKRFSWSLRGRAAYSPALGLIIGQNAAGHHKADAQLENFVRSGRTPVHSNRDGRIHPHHSRFSGFVGVKGKERPPRMLGAQGALGVSGASDIAGVPGASDISGVPGASDMFDVPGVPGAQKPSRIAGGLFWRLSAIWQEVIAM